MEIDTVMLQAERISKFVAQGAFHVQSNDGTRVVMLALPTHFGDDSVS